MYILCEGVLELNNLSIELENEAIRVLSNNIGVDDEWIQKGYKESVGLDKV